MIRVFPSRREGLGTTAKGPGLGRELGVDKEAIKTHLSLKSGVSQVKGSSQKGAPFPAALTVPPGRWAVSSGGLPAP